MAFLRIPVILLFACLCLEAANPGSSPSPGPTPEGAGLREDGFDIPIRTWEAPKYFRLPEVQTSSAPAAPDVSGVSPTPLIFVAVPPCRILDTRGYNPPSPAYGAPALSDQVNREFQVTGKCGIPAGAGAISANATIVTPGGAGYLALWDGGAGSAWPGNSTMNFPAGAVLANAAIVPLSTAGTINARAYVPTSLTTHFLLDVNGYYTSDPVNGPFVRYTLGASQTIPNLNPEILNFGTMVAASADAAGLVTTGAAWHFTAPKAGVYEVLASAYFNSGSWTQDGYVTFAAMVNGVPNTAFGRRPIKSGYASMVFFDGAANVTLAAGDELAVEVLQNSGASKTIPVGPVDNWITIRFVRPYP